MSSMGYGNGIVPSHEDAPGSIVQNPYGVGMPSAPPTSSGHYQSYYAHGLPQPQLVHGQPSSSFHMPATQDHLQHRADFSNPPSSSSSLESSRRAANHKRPTGKAAGTKRKASNGNNEDFSEDDDDEENNGYSHATTMSGMDMPHLNGGGPGDEDKEKQARENHCEIERRRRVKMTTYFAELCDMVPACANLARKPDKLTILRMAAQFMKNIRTNNQSLLVNATSTAQQPDLFKPSFLNDQELKYLMIESCDAFLFALNCDNLRVVYVSDALQNVLSYTCQDWYSRYFYDFVHPDDVEKVREQLNLSPPDDSSVECAGGRVLDLKTGTVKKEGHALNGRSTNNKRSFICRIRVGAANPLDQPHPGPFVNPSILRRRHRVSLGPSLDGHLYEVVHVNGYIRNLSVPQHSSVHHEHTAQHPSSSNPHSQLAFVAMARLQNSCLPNVNDITNGSTGAMNSAATEFTCRCHRDTGEMLFVDQRCTPIIGYKSQELLHKTIYEYIHPDDLMPFQELYKRTATQKSLGNTSASLANIAVRFRTNVDNDYVALRASTYAFCNPCSEEIEFLIVTLLSNQPVLASNQTSVIARVNDYRQPCYENYPRAEVTAGAIVPNAATHYATLSPSAYANTEGQAHADGRAAWPVTNENWSSTAAAAASTNYASEQANLTLYHSYHQ